MIAANLLELVWNVAAGLWPAVEGGILPPGMAHNQTKRPGYLNARTLFTRVPPGGTPDSTAGRMPAATFPT
ncbi:MAG: hypothetical protein HOP33_16835 [Verrucomicrobia bacterium]|nr:hypothetical protein [Verrucomicrobiota bacterium]